MTRIRTKVYTYDHNAPYVFSGRQLDYSAGFIYYQGDAVDFYINAENVRCIVQIKEEVSDEKLSA